MCIFLLWFGGGVELLRVLVFDTVTSDESHYNIFLRNLSMNVCMYVCMYVCINAEWFLSSLSTFSQTVYGSSVLPTKFVQW